MSASPVPPGAPLEAPDLDAIEARANAATPGPWRADKGGSEPYCTFNVQCGTVGNVLNHRAAWPVSGADAAFIAAARTDVPALCAEVRRLRTLVAEAYWEGITHGSRSTQMAPVEKELLWDHSHARAALAPTGEPGHG